MFDTELVQLQDRAREQWNAYDETISQINHLLLEQFLSFHFEIHPVPSSFTIVLEMTGDFAGVNAIDVVFSPDDQIVLEEGSWISLNDMVADLCAMEEYEDEEDDIRDALDDLLTDLYVLGELYS